MATWWELGFGYDAVIDAFQDARLADAIERLWRESAHPKGVEAWWVASADDYAFRWYLNDAAAEMLDAGGITWRRFVIARTEGPPAGAHSLLASRPSA